MLKAFAMDLPDDEMAGEPLFKRQPIVGYFEAINVAGDGTNDFVMIGVHLASGQQNDENHIIAMVLLEHSISAALAANQIRESDRIILGDFNDNPYAVTSRWLDVPAYPPMPARRSRISCPRSHPPRKYSPRVSAR